MSTRPGSPFSARSGYNPNAARLLFPERDWVSAPGDEHRRIILCIDGTGNQFSETNSNILQFFKCLRKDDKKQLVYYQTGIGTYTEPWLVTKPIVNLSMKLDAAIAWNLENHVQDAYRFLMQNYKPGDKVSLFGFSRGAYTARVLAGFVQKIGLLPRENHAQIPFAWKVFKESNSKEGLQACAEYKKSFSLSVRIDFLGLWDTVASLGISGRELPFVKPMRNGGIRISRHALALDERRAKFKPNFKLTLHNDEVSKGSSHNEVKHPVAETLIQGSSKEVWFAGCHCDVGGGSVNNKTRNSLARISLRWMIQECFAEETGITFDANMLFDIGFETIPLEEQARKTGTTFDAMLFNIGCETIPSEEPRKTPRREPPSRPTSAEQDASRHFINIVQLAWTGLRWLLFFLLSPAWYICFLIRHTKLVKRCRRKCEDEESQLIAEDVGGTKCVKFLLNRRRRKHEDEESQLNAEDVDKANLKEVSQKEEELCDVLSAKYDQLSKVWLWWIFEVWPLVIRIQDSKRGRKELETQVNWGKGREIYGDAWNKDENGQEYIAVHRSVFTRMKDMKADTRGYRPRAWFKISNDKGDREFHWEAEITETTREEDLPKDGGWDRIRWVR